MNGNMLIQLNRTEESKALTKSSAKRRSAEIADPHEIGERIRSLSVWTAQARNEHPRRRCFLNVADLGEVDLSIIKDSCKGILRCLQSDCPASTRISALREMISLGIRYHSVRETFTRIGAMSLLRDITSDPTEYQPHFCEETELQEIEELADRAQLAMGVNELYDLCKEAALRMPCIFEVDIVGLCLEIEAYRVRHPELDFIATELSDFLKNDRYGFMEFINYTRALILPECVDLRTRPRNAAEKYRICRLLVTYATESTAMSIQTRALAIIIELSFRLPESRRLFNDINTTGLLRVSTTHITASNIVDSETLKRYLELTRRVELSLRDHEIYPWSNDYYKELNWVLLELLFEYLLSPELFFIGARVLVHTWLDIIFSTSEEMFVQLVSFFVEYHKRIVEYPGREEAELIVLAILEKMEILRDGGPSEIAKLITCDAYVRFINILSSAETEALFPAAFGKIKGLQS